jgi:hypothetical protein
MILTILSVTADVILVLMALGIVVIYIKMR